MTFEQVRAVENATSVGELKGFSMPGAAIEFWHRARQSEHFAEQHRAKPFKTKCLTAANHRFRTGAAA